jgi:hypothetical protein
MHFHSMKEGLGFDQNGDYYFRRLGPMHEQSSYCLQEFRESNF